MPGEAIIVGVLAILGAVLERRHTYRLKKSEAAVNARVDLAREESSRQNNDGYTLLESIDARLADQSKSLLHVAVNVSELKAWTRAHEAQHARDDDRVRQLRDDELQARRAGIRHGTHPAHPSTGGIQ